MSVNRYFWALEAESSSLPPWRGGPWEPLWGVSYFPPSAALEEQGPEDFRLRCRRAAILAFQGTRALCARPLRRLDPNPN